MKTLFQGQFKIVPSNLPDSARQELLQDASPRYMWVALSEPIRQIGHDFLFLVLPVKLTPELVLHQCGQGVLCQTEAEARESMELLSEREKEPIVVVQAAGFGHVGKIKSFRCVITENSVCSRLGKNGRKQWWAWEREIE